MSLALKSAPVVLAMLAASQANAAVVFSNFGPGDAFYVVGGNLVLGENEITIGNADQAMAFTIGGDVDTKARTVTVGDFGGAFDIRTTYRYGFDVNGGSSSGMRGMVSSPRRSWPSPTTPDGPHLTSEGSGHSGRRPPPARHPVSRHPCRA